MVVYVLGNEAADLDSVCCATVLAAVMRKVRLWIVVLVAVLFFIFI
jgi:hypothetical protein